MKAMHIWIVFIFGARISCDKVEKRQVSLQSSSTSSSYLEKECVIPSREGSIYSNFNTNETLFPGFIVNQYEVVNEECEERYFNVDNNRYMICREHGEWFPYIPDKLCYKKCPSLVTENSNIQCTLNGISCDCTNFMINGTRAIQTCYPTHRLSNKVDTSKNELHCLPDGNWNGQLLQCVPIKPLRNNFQNIATAEISQSQPNETSKCILPYKDGTIYSILNTKQLLYPGYNVNQNELVNEDCETGYHKVDRLRIMKCIENGQWETYVNDKLCLKMCPALISDSLKFKCTFNGEDVDCSKPMKNGTTVIPSCKVTHHLPNGEPYPLISLTCLSDGKWDQLFFQCVPFCGKVYNSNKIKPLLWGGTNATHGTAPWNVGIYKRQDQLSYDIICGGTLISENLVVTAAHCFEQTTSGPEKIVLNDGMYKIGIGKYIRDISVKDNTFTQIINTSQIYIKDYYGNEGFYSNDIAIVVLQTKVSLSGFVLPVCLQWKDTPPTIQNGSPGKIVGWGKTNNMRQSPILLESYLPYIDRSTCLKMSKIDFRKYITPDKFCAGSKSGPVAVDEGDSGAGLTYSHNNGLHFLTGIVSVKNTEVNDSVAVFTNIYYHINWIRDIYVKYTNNL